MGELLSFLVVVKSDSRQNPIDGSKEYVKCMKECIRNNYDDSYYMTLYTDVYYAHVYYNNYTYQLMSMLGSDYDFSEGPVPLTDDSDSEYNTTDINEYALPEMFSSIPWSTFWDFFRFFCSKKPTW